MELGLSSHPDTGIRIRAEQRVTETIAGAQLADEVELDVFGIGEQHRLDFAVSSPAVTVWRHASCLLLFDSAPLFRRWVALRHARWRCHRISQVQQCFQNDVFRRTCVTFLAVKQ
jgi:hypothetical protein